MRTFSGRLPCLLRYAHYDADLREQIETHRSLREAQLERDGDAVSPDPSTANIRMLGDVAAGATQSSRFGALLTGASAGAALLLSAVGVFGVFAFDTATRAREVGIRMTLGATPADVTRTWLERAVGPIGAGLAIGTAGVLALGRMQTLLFDVEPTDPLSFATATALLTVVAATASYLPLRRLVRTAPALSLRE